MKSFTYHLMTRHQTQVNSYDKPKSKMQIRQDKERDICLDCPYELCEKGDCELIKKNRESRNERV